jgi:3-oxoacyl-[acyl-carrier-protein] synthase-3
MSNLTTALTAYLMARLQEVQGNLGHEATPADTNDARFADVLDSMGMVEFLALVADDLGIQPELIEKSVGRQFGTVAELAEALQEAGVSSALRSRRAPVPKAAQRPPRAVALGWLAGTAVQLPETVESAAAINDKLGRPNGWLETRAGIKQRCIWGEQDPLKAAAAAGHAALARAGIPAAKVGTLLVVSEAPPLLLGLAAALHHRLQLPSDTVALEIGGACTAFVSAIWTAQALLPQREVILIVAVEAVTRYLRVEPGPTGEAAALFGDASAAMVVCASKQGEDAAPLLDVSLGADGGLAGILQVERSDGGAVALHMRGTELASRAIHVMADSTEEMAARHGLGLHQLAAVVAHGGNGRMPALLALKLGLPPERVWSETPTTGNLGSASLPVAWAAQKQRPSAPVVWAAVGAGLTWGTFLTGDALPLAGAVGTGSKTNVE